MFSAFKKEYVTTYLYFWNMIQLEKLHLEMLNRLAPSSLGNAEKSTKSAY